MIKSKKLIFCLLAVIIVASCEEKQTYNSTGIASEILVVSNDAIWKSQIGDTVRSVFMRPQDGFPNSEANFSIRFVNENNFDKALHSHHNILILDIDNAVVKSKIETLKDEWAQPQRVVKMKSAPDSSFFLLFAKHAEAIVELFEQNERAIARVQNAKDRNLEIEMFLNQRLGINMVISNAMKQVGISNNSICIQSKSISDGLNLIIYTFSYKDSSQLSTDAMTANRKLYFQANSIEKLSGINVSDGLQIVSSKSRKFIFKGMYAVETRGLWKQQGYLDDFPFVSYAIIDAPRQRVVVFDGYVNAEKDSKRSSIRKLESMILDSEFTSPSRTKK